MSNFSKTIVIFVMLLMILFNINFSHATEENLETDVAPISEEVSDAESVASQVTSSLDALSTSSVTRVSNVNSYEQANLQLNNILSIILISIGVLLILFAIAILIRLKK